MDQKYLTIELLFDKRYNYCFSATQYTQVQKMESLPDIDVVNSSRSELLSFPFKHNYSTNC